MPTPPSPPAASGLRFTLLAMVATFGAYFCMYAFRKPFAAAQYADATALLGGLDFKIGIIIAQVMGYALAKFIGIKVISEMRAHARGWLLVGCILAAELPLLGFGFTGGSSWALLWFFLNGIPLGMIWGIVFSYIEGRRSTELLAAVLCASFIVASGAVKALGAWLMADWGVSAYWMPAVAGALFFPALLACTVLLERLPPPDEHDVAQRTQRAPMHGAQRWAFFRRFAPGLLSLLACFMLVTAYRDFRDNFAAEIWDALGYAGTPGIFAVSELPVGFAVLLVLGLAIYIRRNDWAFLFYHWLILGGCVLVGVTTALFQAGLLPGDYWMVLVGVGLYMAYVPYVFLFDRMIAAFRYVATAGFLIYLFDACGYVASITTLLYRNLAQPDLSWLSFFVSLSYWFSLLGGTAVLFALFYAGRRLRKD